jgi:hypothetical protein
MRIITKVKKIASFIKVRKPRIIISKTYPEGDLFLTWSAAHKVFNYIIFVYLPFDFEQIFFDILFEIFPPKHP